MTVYLGLTGGEIGVLKAIECVRPFLTIEKREAWRAEPDGERYCRLRCREYAPTQGLVERVQILDLTLRLKAPRSIIEPLCREFGKVLDIRNKSPYEIIGAMHCVTLRTVSSTSSATMNCVYLNVIGKRRNDVDRLSQVLEQTFKITPKSKHWIESGYEAQLIIPVSRVAHEIGIDLGPLGTVYKDFKSDLIMEFTGYKHDIIYLLETIDPLARILRPMQRMQEFGRFSFWVCSQLMYGSTYQHTIELPAWTRL